MPDDDDDDVPGVTDSKHGLIMALAKARQERGAYRRDLETLQTQHKAAVAAWDAERAQLATVDPTIETDRAELARLRSEAAAWGDERALLAAGITDPEGQDIARYAWNRIPEAERPKDGIGPWVKSDKAPKAVAAYVPTADAGRAPAGGGRAPDPNKGVTPPRGVAAPAKTPEAALAGGTWTQDKEAIAAEMGIKLPDLKTAFHRPA